MSSTQNAELSSTESPQIDRLAVDSWEALFRAQSVLFREFAAEETWAELSIAEYDVLYALSKAPTGLRLQELNYEIMLSQSALSRMVSRLEQKGLLNCSKDKLDRRGINIQLSAAGAALQKQLGKPHAASISQKMLSALNRAELQQLKELCQKLLEQK